MNALVLVFAALLVFAIGYRFYGLFLANKALVLDKGRATPAVVLNDGHDYQPTNKFVLFGHHFAAIAGAGPLMREGCGREPRRGDPGRVRRSILDRACGV